MTRPDKHAARFGDRCRIPSGEAYLPVGFNIRRFTKTLREVLPIIRRISEGLRNRTMAAVPSQTQLGRIAIVPATGELGTYEPQPCWRCGATYHAPPGCPQLSGTTQANILDRIDDTLVSYDATSQPDDRPWPYRGF